jgi:hypothetical protein
VIQRPDGLVGYFWGAIRNAWEGEKKRGALAELRFNPEASAVAFDNFFAQGQAYTHPRIFCPTV